MTNIVTNTEPYRPWLHRFALLTAVAVFPLVSVGALVTSLRVGMADPVSVRVPWYIFTLPWSETGIGVLIEHGHRHLGWIGGVLAIVLAVWLWLAYPQRRLKWLGVAALVGVSVQGILGILRVRYDGAGWGIEFAMIHGVTGQLVFALYAGIALVTSRSWWSYPAEESGGGERFRKMARLTTLLLVLQLFIGVWLRQQGEGPGYVILIAHAVIALAVAAHAVMLVVRAYRGNLALPSLFRCAALTLCGLMVLQVALGLSAWLFGAGAGAFDYRPVTGARAGFASAHVATGALMLATSLILTMRAHRHLTVPGKIATVGLGTMEVVA